MYGRVVSLGRPWWAVRTFAYHVAYNALARGAPQVSSAIQRLTHDTGRGCGRDGEAAADYFEAVLADYLTIAEVSGVGDADLLRGKRVLELGPGDTRAFALLAHLEGASVWEGFDSFDIQSRSARYLDEIYAPILARRNAPRHAKDVLMAANVHTDARALLRGGRRFDVIVSRAVLEHARDLDALFALVSKVAIEDAVWLHKVDLRDHGIRYDHDLDFLRFSERAWHAMSSHIDLPNRVRASGYFTVAERVGLRTIWAATTHVLDADVAVAARTALASPFREMDARELSVLGLWLVQVGASHRLASRVLTASALGPAPHDRLSRY